MFHDDRAEVVVAQSIFFIPVVHPPDGLCRLYFSVENPVSVPRRDKHSECRDDICTCNAYAMTLDVSPFVL